MSSESPKKSIAKNTLYLYLRKVVSLVISLYTSRLVLEMLGVTEFGIYGLVGSIVALFSALRGLFSTSIQRFINIAKGNGSEEKVCAIFSIGVKIHVWISIIFFLVVEIAGILLIPYLNIPENSYSIAQWVLLFSVLAAIATILTVPYDALIIANERFKAYSIISIVEYVLRLGVIFLLIFSPVSRVVFYSILVFIVSLIVRIINAIYCKRNFGSEARYRNITDRQLFKEMTVFAGWQFFGNLGYTLTNNGLNFIINIFGGVVVNAARTIAYQVMTAVYQFVSDINVSFQPQSMMLFSQGKKKEFEDLMILNSKATFSICFICVFPVLLLTFPILRLWLKEVPDYTVGFVQAILIYLIIRSFHGPIDMLFKCDGRLKKYQLTELTVMALNLPVSWFCLKNGMPYFGVFLIMGLIELINTILILIIAKKQIGFNIGIYIKKIIIPSALSTAILLVFFILDQNYSFISLDDNLIYYISIGCFLVLFATGVVFLIMFNTEERRRFLKHIPFLKNNL